MSDAAVQDQMTARVTRQALRIAANLRAAADNVERHASKVTLDLGDMKLNHSEVAGEVARDVQRLMGNLGMEQLIAIAFEADAFARRETR